MLGKINESNAVIPVALMFWLQSGQTTHMKMGIATFPTAPAAVGAW